MKSLAQAVTRFWDDWQLRRGAERRRDEAGTRWVDWGDHPRVLERVLERAFGPPRRTLYACLGDAYPQLKTAHALSLCCGDAGFERQLLAAGVVRRVTGIDLSPVRVASAAPADGLELRVDDVNGGDFGRCGYDAIIAKAALHHIERLETAFEGMVRALKPGGFLLAIDFFGPTRFQWTDVQLDAANRFLETEVPEALRRQADGSLYRASRPTVAHVIETDPSEAVRSGEIMDLLPRYFPRVEVRDVGGTLLNLIFAGTIVNNFDERNPAHNGIVDRACALEQSLLEAGAITSDFKIVAAYLE
jgi:SAM-dependent methyltransferase